MAVAPIITNLPGTVGSLQRKYQTLGPSLSTLPPNIVQSLYAYDAQRALRGAQPISSQQTALALATALSGNAATPPKTRSTSLFSVPGNAVHDLGQIASSIPRLPLALYREARALPQAPGDISRAFGAGSPSKVISALTEVPGIRDLPTSYTIHNLATGHPGEILRHPLMSLLDLYPAAEATGLTAKLGEQAAVVGGKFAASEAGSNLIADVKGLKPVQFAQEMVGKTARTEAVRKSLADTALKRAFEANPSVDFAAKYAEKLSEPDRILATNAMEQGTVDALPAHLQGFVADYQEALTHVENVATKDNVVQRVENYGGQGQSEVLDNTTANKFIRKDRLAQMASNEGELRTAIESGQGDLSSLAEQGALATSAPDWFFANNKQRFHYLQGVTQAFDAAGYDASPLRQLIRRAYRVKSGANTVSREEIAQAFKNFPDVAVQHAPRVTPEDIITKYAPAARSNPKLYAFLDNIKNGHFAEAVRHGKDIANRTTFRPVGWDETLDSVRALRDRQKILDKPPVFDERTVAKAIDRRDQFVATNPPARFKPLIIKGAEDQVLIQHAKNPDFQAITTAVAERNYKSYPGLAKDVMDASDEIAASWATLRDEGLDPVFVHHVSPSSTGTLTNPKVLGHFTSEGWANKRTLDVTPYVHDATVALNHQALETLQRLGTREYLDSVVNAYGRHAEAAMGEKAPLLNDYIDRARRRYPDQPELVRQEAEKLMKKEYGVFDPSTIFPKGSRLTNFGEEPVWMPKTVIRNIERMHTPLKNGFTAVLDPVMRVFRTSLLPLSPRWQVNNVIGGGMIAAVEDPGIFKFLPEAIEMQRTGKVPAYIAEMSDRIGHGTGLGSVPREVLEWNQAAPVKAMHQYLAGKTMKRLYEAAGTAREAISTNVIDRAYEANEFMDDAYRSAAYMRGYDKALTKGLTSEEAQLAGVTLARKILPRWNAMTPLERSIMRYTFPFYGWISHIMPYVLQYPFDHPFRAEVMSAFTRNELADQGTGLPERFLNSLFLGHTDSRGHIKAIQTGGMNPFSSVASYFTWAGFTGNANPIIGGILQSLGVDTSNGGPELYPELIYDPESGRVTARGKSLLPSLLSSIVPQSEILTALLGSSADFKSLLKGDPAAARRALLTAGGLPIIYRDIKINDEYIKAELARESAQATAKSAALKSGNIDSLNRYPALRGYVAQLHALQASGQLQQYQPDLAAK